MSDAQFPSKDQIERMAEAALDEADPHWRNRSPFMQMRHRGSMMMALCAAIPAPPASDEGGDTITITVPRRLLPEMVQWAEDELSRALEDTAFDRDLRRALEVLRALDPADPTLESVLSDLAKRQEPLGAEFEQALEADREGLYEP